MVTEVIETVPIDIEELARQIGNDPYALLQLLLALAGKTALKRIIRCPEYPTVARTPDLDKRLQSFRDCASKNRFEVSRIFAELYKKCFNKKERKRKGQYFTPRDIANAIAKQLEASANDTILEPGMGTGIIASAILKELGDMAERVNYLGIEIDPIMALSSAVSLDLVGAPQAWRLLYANFLPLDQIYLRKIGITRITAIVSNPPFVRFHRIRRKKQLIRRISQRAGLNLSGLSGLHSFFLGQSVSLLDSGRIMFVFPVGMENVNHGSRLLEQLKSKFEITKTNYGDLELFRFVEGVDQSTPTKKVANSGVRLGSIASVRRGISTGSNNFFVLTEEAARRRQIPQEYLLEVVPSRIHLRGNVFRPEDLNKYRKMGKPCWLLHIPNTVDKDRLPSNIKQYLDEGIQRRVNLISTCRVRDKWYAVKTTKQPHLIFTYMYRKNRNNKTGKPSFLFNEANAYILTNLLGVYLQGIGKVDARRMRRIAVELTESISDWIDNEDAARKYARGLMKFEPRHLERMPISRRLLRILGVQSIDRYLLPT